MIKRVLMFVSGVYESVLVDFISQNCPYQKFSYKNEQIYFLIFFEFLSCC